MPPLRSKAEWSSPQPMRLNGPLPFRRAVDAPEDLRRPNACVHVFVLTRLRKHVICNVVDLVHYDMFLATKVQVIMWIMEHVHCLIACPSL